MTSFEKVSTEIIKAISEIEETNPEEAIMQMELLMNIYKFIHSEEEYRENLRILNQYEKEKRIMYEEEKVLKKR